MSTPQNVGEAEREDLDTETLRLVDKYLNGVFVN